MNQTLSRFFATVALVVGATTVSIAHAEVVVVVSAKNPTGPLTADQVAQIFLGKTSTFPAGGPATPIDQSEGNASRNEFYAKVTGKDAAQVKAYWTKLVFTGKSQPPKEVSGNGEVKKLVAENPGLIGYIDKSAADGSVKVVLTP